jgi:uncharacterized membrane protein
MRTFLKTIEFLTLGIWLGSDVFLSFVVAPGAFSVLANRDAAGMFVGYALTHLHLMGILLGVLFLLARAIRMRGFDAFSRVAGLCVVLMVVLTGLSQFTVSNRMQRLKQDMGSVQNTAESDPRRMEFDRLHHVSVGLEGAILFVGLLGMSFLVKEVSVNS